MIEQICLIVALNADLVLSLFVVVLCCRCVRGLRRDVQSAVALIKETRALHARSHGQTAAQQQNTEWASTKTRQNASALSLALLSTCEI